MSSFLKKEGSLAKFLAVALTFCLVVSMSPASGSLGAAQAEVTADPAQMSTQADDELSDGFDARVLSEDEIDEQIKNGALITTVDKSDVKYNVEDVDAKDPEKTKANSLPAKVDLRNWTDENGNTRNLISSVKDQKVTGTCWSFAANGTSETSIARATGKDAVELSPYQTVYFAYNALPTNQNQLMGTEKTQAGEGITWPNSSIKTQAGLLYTDFTSVGAASMFFQGCGVARASDIEFPSYALSRGGMSSTLSQEKRRNSIARLKKFNSLGSLVISDDYATEFLGTNETVLNRIKSELAHGNSVDVGYCADTVVTNLDGTISDSVYISKNYAHYTCDLKFPSHAVQVVGYDDNYSKNNFIEGKQPEKDGAFIVKNSWGEKWGFDGYFYLSYWDRSITDAATYEYDLDDYDETYIDVNREIVDQYDYLSNQAIYKRNTNFDVSYWYSNTYVASKNQKIHSIGTYYCSDGKELKYRIYKLKDDATTPKDVVGSLASPLAEGTYSAPYEGYAKIDLDTPVVLKEGERYAIWFQQTDNSGNYCAPQATNRKKMDAYLASDNETTRIYDANLVLNAKESFYCTDFEGNLWTDYTDSFRDDDYYARYFDNYCVKGYATAFDFSVAFNTNCASDVQTQLINENSKAEEPKGLTKAGFTLEGWYTDENFQSRFDFNTPVTGDVTLHAKWMPDVEDPCIVTFDVQGHGTKIDEQAIVKGSSVKAPDDPVDEAYTFGGWYEDAGFLKKVDLKTATFKVDATLYAKWTIKTFTVKFDNQGHGSKPEDQKVQYGDLIAYPQNSQTEYLWYGWFYEPECTTKFNSSTPITKDLTLYGSWEHWSTTVEYYGCGATSGKMDDSKHEFSVKTRLKKNEFVKKGYAFKGWSIKEGGDVEYEDEQEVMFNSYYSIKLYAVWEELAKFSISYNLNGGSVEGNPETYVSDDEAFTLKNPTKDGCTFTGWTGSNGSTPQMEVTIQKGSEGNRSYVANWTKKEGQTEVTKVKMHRLYNPFTGEHFYTAKDDETRGLVDLGWTDEGVGWTAPSLSSVPVYRLYNPYVEGGDHHYTTKLDEYESLKGKGWSQEGIAWYSDESEGVPLYRQYNPNAVTGTHNYTSSVDEKKDVIAAGWKDEGIGWYGLM